MHALRRACAAYLFCGISLFASDGLDSAALRFERWTSTELPELKAVLERAGWPATHVHAVLNAEIQLRYNPEPEISAADLRPFEFWRTGPDALPLAHLDTPARRAQREECEARARAKHDELFPPQETSAEPLRQWDERRRWGDLPPGKREQVETLLAATDRAVDELIAPRGGMLTAGEWNHVRAAVRDARTRLEALLSPGELLDYDLRNSRTAEQMREELDAFEPTQDEFVAIFKLRHRLELEFDPRFHGLDAEGEARRERAVQACQLEIARLLGAERYRDYEISLEPACQTLRFDGRFARVDAPTIRALYRDLLAAKADTRALDVSEAPKDEARAAHIKAQLYAKFRQVLDDEGTRRYLQEQDFWP